MVWQAREAEERKAEDASNPLKSAIETYALTPADIEAFISYFGAMDVERKGAGHLPFTSPTDRGRNSPTGACFSGQSVYPVLRIGLFFREEPRRGSFDALELLSTAPRTSRLPQYKYVAFLCFPP